MELIGLVYIFYGIMLNTLERWLRRVLGVVRVEFFEPVFPFSRFPVVKTPLELTNHRPSTGLREYGQRSQKNP